MMRGVQGDAAACALPQLSQETPQTARRVNANPVQARILPRSAGANSFQRRRGQLTSASHAPAAASPSRTQALAVARTVDRVAGTRLARDDDQPMEQQQQHHHLAEENASLRREIARLQVQLVEKIRGGSKILVGGGQFRPIAKSLASPTAALSPSLAGPRAQPVPCSDCASMRSVLKKTQEEHAVARNTIETYDERLVTLSEERSRAFETIRTRDREIRQLLSQADLLNSQLAQWKRDTSRLQQQLVDTVKTYQKPSCDTASQAPSLQESMVSASIQCLLLPPGSGSPSPTGSSGETVIINRSSYESDISHLKQSLATLEDEYLAAKTNWNDEREGFVLTIDSLRKSQEAQQTDTTRLLQKHNAELRTELVGVKERCVALEQEVTTLRHECEALANRTHVLQTRIQEFEKSEIISRDTLEQLETRLSDSLRNASMDQLQAEELHAQLNVLMAEKSTMETHLRSLKETLTTKEGELALLRLQLSETRCDVESKSSTIAALTEQAASLEEMLATTQFKAQGNENRAVAAEADVESRDELVRRLKRSHATAIEKAVQSAVRLCVVAPTVNVQVGGSGGGPTVNCRTVIPDTQLRDSLQRDVLPRFTAIFVQDEEGTGPCGSPMNVWLQNLLKEMQSSLAEHLQRLYTATTTK